MKSMKRWMIGMTLSAALAGGAFGESKMVCDGSSTVGPLAKAFAEFYMKSNPEAAISVSESGSGNGAKAMMGGTCDVADMSRPMKDEEFKKCVENGIMPCAHVIALDGIAVVVHKSNPVNGLTLEQLRDIFTGKISNWKDVGGADAEIVLISRDTNSGTYETFENLVMNKQKMSDRTEVVGSNGQAKSRVESTQNAIGYVGLGFTDGLKALTVNGIEASAETIQSGSYPVARPLFMYTNGYPKLGSDLYRFVTLYLSKEGQQIVEEIGFVPVTAY